jgi:hypothetical protein
LRSKKFKISRLFYVSYFNFLYNCFINFVVQNLNSKIVETGMVVLTGREKSDVGDADVAMGWMLQRAAGAVVGKRERKLIWRGRE